MILLLLLLDICLLCSNTQADQSFVTLTDPGSEFIPMNSIALVITLTSPSVTDCGLQCNQRMSCRTFDFDLLSSQCRLFEADLTTGSIIANPLKPQSYVGLVQLSSTTYSVTHDKSCTVCAESRYETCNSNFSSTCQCPPNTYWDQTICRTQLFENQTCSYVDACRADFNLTCEPCYTDEFRTCTKISALPFGTTVAGYCNGTFGRGSTGLYQQHGLFVTGNGTIYTADTQNKRLQAFLPNSRFGVTILSNTTLKYPQFVVANSNASIIYVSDFNNNKVFLHPKNLTIPQLNTGGGCALNQINGPTGLAIDSQGNVYIASRMCHQVLKWAGPDANTSIRVAGTGVAGSSSTQLNNPYGLYLDENNSALYVADLSNHRIQKFFLNSNSTVGITVAGGNGLGSALNQLSSPCGFAVSSKDGSIYVADNGNHRIVRWIINGTEGIIVAGSSNALAGKTALLLNAPFEVKFDANEDFLYVSDLNNNRIQRFSMTV